MKKVIMVCIILLSLCLCSCSNPLPEETSTDELIDVETVSMVTGLSQNETSTDELTSVETVPYETHTEEPAGKELVSAVFMGEKFTAPGSYLNVPDLYVPVLDDLYLYCELLLRYESLVSEDKDNVIRECKDVQSEIQNRGHLPYPGDGLGFTGGYALVDLDGDGSLELLILNNPPHYTYIPVIKSVFAIRDGRLVCIDNGSHELNNTILAADGTFYQFIDWHGSGYASLCTFRLEAGMSAFTIISEAYASLFFVDGDVPVPYWVKIENREEAYITEDEFNIILGPFKNPEEKMILDFVTIHPTAADSQLFLYTLEKPSSVIPIEYPESYHNVPMAYKYILDALFLLEERIRREDYDSGEGLEIVGFAEYPYPLDIALGYALVDLNNDGIPELLLGTVEGLVNSAPNSIFTLKDGEPILVETFWSRSRCVISADGIIYNVGSGGATNTMLSSYRFDKGANTLTELSDIYSDYSSSEEKLYYTQVVDGKNHYITEEDFNRFTREYDNPSKPLKLTVVPISR